MTITLNALQKQRRDTASNWTTNNTVLLAGEWGIESDTKKFKIGDGSTAWQSLDYVPIPDVNRSLPGNLTVEGDFTVNGTTTTIDTTNLSIEDKNIELGKVSSPSDTTADGGGITLKGATDKTINWVNSTNSWTLSENLDLPSGKVLKINGSEILSSTQYTGSAAKLTTPRNIAGVSFDGSADISLNNNAITNGAGYISSVATQNINDDAVTIDKIAANAVGADQLANMTLPSGVVVVSANIAAGQLVTGHIAAGTGFQIGTDNIIDDVVTFAKMQNISTSKLLGRTSSSTGNIEELSASTIRTLLNVEDGATADQSASEIKSAYESNSDTNAFTDALLSKLNGIASSATNVTNNNQISNGAGYVTSSVINSLNASNLSSGTIPDARFPSVLPAISGANLTNLPSSGGISNVVEDTSPQLGGDLQSNGNDIDFADNDKAIFGTGTDLQIFSDGSTCFLKADDLRIRSTGNENYLTCAANGAVEIFHDSEKKLHTTGGGVVVTGDFQTIGSGGSITANEHLKIPNDTGKLFIGASNDLQIYHNGTDSIIDFSNTSHSLKIMGAGGSNFIDLQPRDNNSSIKAIANGASELYFDGGKKLNTSSSGIIVTGSVSETSDIALKSDIQPLTNTLEKLQQIKGYKYNLINSISPSIGVIAQDVEKVFPEIVHGSEGKKTLQYSGLIGVLVEAIKDLSAKVAALEAV